VSAINDGAALALHLPSTQALHLCVDHEGVCECARSGSLSEDPGSFLNESRTQRWSVVLAVVQTDFSMCLAHIAHWLHVSKRECATHTTTVFLFWTPVPHEGTCCNTMDFEPSTEFS
jgi:hypothetical protein